MKDNLQKRFYTDSHGVAMLNKTPELSLPGGVKGRKSRSKMFKNRNLLGIVVAVLWAACCTNQLFGATGKETVEPTTRVFQEGEHKLVVYSDVPGVTPSEFYRIRVRSDASKGVWQPVFAHITRSLYSQAKIQTRGNDEVKEHYQRHLKDWSHTYGNIEMNGPVEVEISKADGTPIKTAVTHPIVRAGKARVENGKAYFTLDKPAPITVDIDGKMDEQHTGDGYEGPPIHTVSLFAHPIFEKPSPTDPGVVVVKPGQNPPTDPATYKTLYFSAGVHDIGRNFKVHENRQYYIAGDAVVYGTFNNLGAESGKNIKIFGVGTISGDRLKHNLYDPAYLNAAVKPSAEEWKSICIKNAENVLVEGVCVANPANHGINLMARPGKSETNKVTFVRWAKVISWRANGDGIGSAHVVEDCFLRTADDCSYMKGDRRRCVFWKDVNGAVFHMANISAKFPIVIEDCDVLYLRDKNAGAVGSGVFVQRGEGLPGNHKVNVLVRNFRIEDKFPTSRVFQMFSKSDSVIGKASSKDSGEVGSGYSGISFQNITAAAKSVVGQPNVLRGCAEAPWSQLTFENVVIGGKKLTSLGDFAHVNEFVTDITFK